MRFLNPKIRIIKKSGELSMAKKKITDTLSARRSILFLILFFISIIQLSGVNFQDINLSGDDRLIFRADFDNQHAVFVSQLNDMSIRQLTAYPEKIYLVDNGKTIIALSRFGAMNIPAAGGIPAPLNGYPSFANGSIPLGGRLQDISPSADGRWALYAEPVSPSYGNLILIDIHSGIKRTVSEKIELPASDFPVKWSPDSRFFVYSKAGRLYYFPLLNNLSSLVDERFRMIGPGGINSVLWGQQGDFYYITENTLYRVINPELFTRTMYGDFLSIGNTAAVLPVNFDPGFDRFWISPDSASILINKNGRGFFIFTLGETNSGAASVLPHVILSYGTGNFNVFWAKTGSLTILCSVKNEIKAWRFEKKDNSIIAAELENTPSMTSGTASGIALSPDETKAVFWGERGIELWDYAEWKLIQRLSDTAVLSCAWGSNRQIITGNSRYIEEINISLSSYPRRRICLSGADEIGFENTSGASRILARMGTQWFATDGRSAWTAVSNIQLRPISFSSERFRVFLEVQNNDNFLNTPMIRNLHSSATVSLTAKHRASGAFTQPAQTAGEPRLRLPVRQIALCFDLYDDDTGLLQTLAALSRFNKKATFFLNGEFIRRNPQAVKMIVENGHETASLFYAPIDLSDARYRITQSFITQGLARNEDEFNRVTGKELSVIWHPPFYRSSDLINSAARAAGYFTAVRTVDPGDWLSKEDSLRLNMRQIPPSEMIEQIILKSHNGAVIPVRLGLISGGRDEYLFQRIEVLLDALIRSGCEVVPVSAVISR